MIKRAHEEELVPIGRELFIHRRWSATQAEIALQSLASWASDQQRQPSGGVRLLLMFGTGNGQSGPDTEFAVTLR
jgi:hypothetical protein